LSRFFSKRLKGPPGKQKRVQLIVTVILLSLPFVLDGNLLLHRLNSATDVASGSLPRWKYYQQFRDGRDFSLSADLKIAQFITENSTKDDHLFIWGFEPLVYFLASRQPASRFITHQPLSSRWQMPGWREELMEDLEQNRPLYFLVLRNDQMPVVTGYNLDSLNLLGQFASLSAYLRKHYKYVGEMEDFLIYRRL